MIAMLRPDDTSTPSPTSRWLVSTDWLADHLRDRNVIAVDGSYFLPTQQRDAHAEYRDGHIPGAVFFDIEKVCDDSTELPHMLPGPTHFGKAVGALGIGDGDTVVVYDSRRLSTRRRGCGGRFGFSARRKFTFSMAACRNGKPKAVRWRKAIPNGRRKHSPPK